MRRRHAAIILAFAAAITTVVEAQSIHVRLRIPPGAPSGVVTASDLTYLGAIRPPAIYDTSGARGGVTMRTVDGEVHFLFYGTSSSGSAAVTSGGSTTAFYVTEQTINNSPTFLPVGKTFYYWRISAGTSHVGEPSVVATAVNRTVGIAVGTSNTIFTLASGTGSRFANGDAINVRRSANGFAAEARTISTIVGDVVTVNSALGGAPNPASDYITAPDKFTMVSPVSGTTAAGDLVYIHDTPVYEMVDPAAASCNSGAYNATITSAPRGCIYANWGNIWHGKEVSWLDDGTAQNPAGVIEMGLTWSDATSMLYSCDFQQYVSGSIYPCDGTTLDNVGTLASTSYGPWKITTVDRDSATIEGSPAGAYFQAGPSGIGMIGGTFYQLVGWPAGPNLSAITSCTNCTSGWPTATTPGGYGSAVVNYSDRYLRYYTMLTNDPSGNYWNSADTGTNGSLHGTFRGFPSARNPLLWEPTVFSFTAGMNIPAETPLRTEGNPLANQYWGWSELDNQTGCTWFTGTHKSSVICSFQRQGAVAQTTTCTTDGTSGAHHWYNSTNSDTCSHGCYMVADFGVNVTGPGTNERWPGLALYDPSDLLAVHGGTKNDYAPVPVDVIDARADYGIFFHRNTAPGNNTFTVVGIDTVRKYLFVAAVAGDEVTSPGQALTVIYVFAINDSAPPEPTLWSWLSQFIPNMATGQNKTDGGRRQAHRPASLLERPR